MCDTMVVVKADGVLFAKNSDRDPNEAQGLEWQPRRAHPAGATLRATHIEIPQVRETHAILISRPFWMWGAEMGSNEHGVTIGNEAVFTREPLAKTGLTGMDLLRLALERAATARDAVAVITALLEMHGQGGGCGLEHPGFSYHNSFLVADPRGAFVLETAGKHWAVEDVQGARTISNGLSIPGFAERHSDRLRTRVAASAARSACSLHSVQRDATVAGFMRALRCHGDVAWPEYSPLNGALRGPCAHAGGLVVATQTTASWVAELRVGEAARHWVTATAAPCVSLFKPVAVDTPLDLLFPTGARADASLWWQHERLHRRLMRAPARLAADIVAERDALEAEWLANPVSSAEAFAEHAKRLAYWNDALWLPGMMLEDTRPWYVKRYWKKRNALAGMGD